jgi:hypothetical protein
MQDLESSKAGKNELPQKNAKMTARQSATEPRERLQNPRRLRAI